MNRFLTALVTACTVLVLLCPRVGSSGPEAAQTAEALFQQANAFYGQGNYRQALEIYSTIIARDGVSAPLLYNLGNCYAQTGQTGRAIVNYERALLLSPADSDIRGNLELLRKNQGLFQDGRPLLRRLLSVLDLNQWTLAAALFFVLLTLTSLAGLRPAGGKLLRRWITGICLLAMAVTSAGAFSQYRQLQAAVVIAGDAHLLLSPFAAAASVATLQEGRIVYSTSQHGNYTLVQDETGPSGWIETRAIEPVMPSVTGP